MEIHWENLIVLLAVLIVLHAVVREPGSLMHWIAIIAIGIASGVLGYSTVTFG